jgi:hypothetical protein
LRAAYIGANYSFLCACVAHQNGLSVAVFRSIGQRKIKSFCKWLRVLVCRLAS